LIKKPQKFKKPNVVIAPPDLLETEKKKEPKREDIENDLQAVLLEAKKHNPNLNTPIILPFSKNTDEDELINDNLVDYTTGHLEENNMFLFQFPRLLPFNIESQLKAQKEEKEIEEPVYDNHGFLVKNDFVNSFYALNQNSKFGKLIIYKSGAMKLQIDQHLFNVHYGIQNKFAQEVALTNHDKLYFLGKLSNKKIIVTPDH